VFITWNISANVWVEVQLIGLQGSPFNKVNARINLIKLFHVSEYELASSSTEQQLYQSELLAVLNISEAQIVAGSKVRNSKHFKTENEIAEYNVVSKVKVQ
jgi:hypothetical protein